MPDGESISEGVHLVVRHDYAARPNLFEATVCGLVIERFMTLAFHDLPWTIEEQSRLNPGCCGYCEKSAYGAREAQAGGVRAYLREVLGE